MSETFDLKEIWGKLREEKSIEDGYFRQKYPTKHAAVFLAVDSATKFPAILLKLSPVNIPSNIIYPESKKFEVFPIYNAEEKKVTIFLKLNDQNYYDIFTILAEVIIRRIAEASSEKKCIEVFIDELHRWQEFLKQYTGNVLSEEAQRGLYGELYFLKEVLIKHVTSDIAIKSWQGAERAIHDFQIGTQAVEVKTYAGASQVKIMVSNVRQLDSSGLKKLFLGVFLLDVRKSENNTLPQMVKLIEDMLTDNLYALKMFKEKLIRYGYLDGHIEQYSLSGYAVIDAMYYHVDEAFPKITHTNVPEGIGDLKYSVMLSACVNSKISQELLVASLKDFINE